MIEFLLELYKVLLESKNISVFDLYVLHAALFDFKLFEYFRGAFVPLFGHLGSCNVYLRLNLVFVLMYYFEFCILGDKHLADFSLMLGHSVDLLLLEVLKVITELHVVLIPLRRDLKELFLLVALQVHVFLDCLNLVDHTLAQSVHD